MPNNQFFEKKGPFSLNQIKIAIKASNEIKTEFQVHDINDLKEAKSNEITFLNSNKYKFEAANTKAGACVTMKNLSNFLPSDCAKLYVDNVLFAVTNLTRLYYPKADSDYPDMNLISISKNEKNFRNVTFGNNSLIGKNVEIGDGTIIGNNTIIESNVNIGKNCLIGSMVIIKNSIIGNNVHIQDGVKIGLKGFGFIPIKNKNLRTPHVGCVVLKDGVEVGSGSTIDRGSLSNTIIGENTFLDNQVHVAHNVKIGKNCMIAGQVGFAGSSHLGDNVIIGGQAGVSGHLKIGNNVSIGGASGVIKNIPDNSKVMGYPAVDFKQFVKKYKKDEKEFDR